MYFKRLEIIGFKSFANKTKLKFEPGVTAIVGPNGCGKSNISDAIKWVLGEQSAKVLRGSRMEDIIFNGTSNKEAINMAEVSLVLSNRDRVLPIDYEEVTITRRLFRSGESEYLINKMPVRLKDVNELVAGTGMGTSSYSIIEQGKIGQILSSKPEERRQLFEEASGITKYKIKKKEALRKLEHTENNLIRLNDIIGEVERQIKSIERQAKKAEKYKIDFDVLKELELKYSSHLYRNVNNDFKTVSLETGDLRKREEELQAVLKKFTEDRYLAKEIIDGINDELNRAQALSAQTRASIENNTHTIKVDTERIEELKVQLTNLGQEIEGLNNKEVKRREDLVACEKELTSISAEKENKQKSLDEQERKMQSIVQDIEGFQSEIKNAKSKMVDFLSSQTKTKNELIKLGADMQNEKSRLRRLKIEKENIATDKGTLDEKMRTVSARFDSAKQELEKENASFKVLNEVIASKEAMLTEARESLTSDKRRISELESKLELLKELINNLEGFSRGVKEIKEHHQQSASVACDLLNIESGYEAAVEASLGELAQSVFVKTNSEASQLVHFIKNGDFGKINFIIQEDAVRLKQRPPRSILKDCPHITNFLKYDTAHNELFSYLFRDTYIARDENEADSMFLQFKDFRFVTKSGYLRQGPHILSGSLIENDTSIVARRNKVKETEGKLSQAIEDLNRKTIEIESMVASLQELRVNAKNLEQRLREKEAAFAGTVAERSSILNDIKRIEDERDVIDAEIEDVSTSLEAITTKGEELNVVLNREEQEVQGAEELIANSERMAKERTVQKEEMLFSTANLKAELSSIGASYEGIQNNLNMKKSEYGEITGEKQAKMFQQESSTRRINELVSTIREKQTEKEVLELKKNELETSILSLSDKKVIENEEFDKKESIVKEKEEELEILRNNARDLEIKVTEINYKKTSLIEKIRQAYKIELDQYTVDIDENTVWDEERERIEELKIKLDKMGAVNLVAIEEHKELEERFSFLTKQRDDLVNAKESLYKAITKINVTTRKLFIETFQKAQIEFRNYFRMLFGGGHAEIFLLDERDILESGIEIVARPPGKKLQNILLLSGGEKALTAISLLFAIFKINPSPFCILDEIDAPLDEINIDRFTRVLYEFVKISQFIMITHNKKTIQMADILYGITMAEKGVSKIVSVKFTKSDEKDKDKEKMMV